MTIDYYLSHRPYCHVVLLSAQEAKQRIENFNTKVCLNYKSNVFYHDYVVYVMNSLFSAISVINVLDGKSNASTYTMPKLSIDNAFFDNR